MEWRLVDSLGNIVRPRKLCSVRKRKRQRQCFSCAKAKRQQQCFICAKAKATATMF
ncbi:hypothetical protein [Lysinibacillus sp. TE18511]